MKNKVARYRLLFSKMLLLILITALVVFDHGAITNQAVSISFDFIGFALVLIGGFGRIWASLYIEGNKIGKIISKGPYSMMRNPLYVFSLILLTGYCFAIQSAIIASISIILFALIYLPTIYNEEKRLLDAHNQSYKNYYQKTPRFLPKVSLYEESDSGSEISVNIRNIRNVLVEIAGFIFFFGIIKLLDLLHYMDAIPNFYILY